MNDSHPEPSKSNPCTDLSHIHANLDGDDAGQDGFDALPDDIKVHIVAPFVHKAGLGPPPGKLKRPTPKKTE